MRHTPKKGFAVLIVLVAVAIVMILYFVQMGTLFGPAGSYEVKGIEDHPWVLEELLVAEGEDIKLPRKPKPTLDDPLTVTMGVRLDGADRGQATITFEPNGRIHSHWECGYLSDTVRYQITADMNGNIDAKHTYRDESGKNKSCLFFIARGSYTKSPIEDNASVMGEKGTAWITGWLKSDLSINGHITITTNRQWAGVYRISHID